MGFMDQVPRARVVSSFSRCACVGAALVQYLELLSAFRDRGGAGHCMYDGHTQCAVLLGSSTTKLADDELSSFGFLTQVLCRFAIFFDASQTPAAMSVSCEDVELYTVERLVFEGRAVDLVAHGLSVGTTYALLAMPGVWLTSRRFFTADEVVAAFRDTVTRQRCCNKCGAHFVRLPDAGSPKHRAERASGSHRRPAPSR